VRQSYSKPKVGRFLGHGVEPIHSTASVRETVYDTGCIYVKRRITVYVQPVYSASVVRARGHRLGSADLSLRDISVAYESIVFDRSPFVAYRVRSSYRMTTRTVYRRPLV